MRLSHESDSASRHRNMLKSSRVDIPHVGALIHAIGFVRQPQSGQYACVLPRAIATCVTFSFLVLSGCGSSVTHTASSSTGSPTTIRANSGPQLPQPVSDWLGKRYAVSPIGHATSADWVLTTHGKAATITSGVRPGDKTPVYLFDVHGSFVWHHSCLAGAPASACTSVGTDEVFTVDPQRLQVLDFGVEPRSPNLAQFGTVGHIAL
jgi:hypothetical protein